MLLFDQNISYRIVRLLKEAYPGCRHISKCGLVGASDRNIRAYAKRHQLAVVSFDQDHFELAALLGHPPKVILLRSRNSGTLAISHLLRKHRERILDCMNDESADSPSVLELP